MKKEANKIRWGLIIIIILVILATSSFGSLSSVNPESDAWYNQVKSSITPPGYVFGIVWPILYILIGVSIYLSLKNKNQDRKSNKKIIFLWLVNLIANAFWTYFFFGMQNPSLALGDLALVWLSCIMLITANWKKHKLAANLLWPYLVWLSFAALLNFLTI